MQAAVDQNGGAQGRPVVGYALGGRTFQAGETLRYQYLIMRWPVGVEIAAGLDAKVAAAVNLGQPESGARVVAAQGAVTGTQVFLDLQAAGGVFRGTLEQADLGMRVPLRLAGLNAKWTAGVWGLPHGLLVPLAPDPEGLAWFSLNPATDYGRFFAGHPVMCDRPEVILRVLQRTKGGWDIVAHNSRERGAEVNLTGGAGGPWKASPSGSASLQARKSATPLRVDDGEAVIMKAAEREKQASGGGKRLALRREMTFREIFQRFPQTRLLAMRCLGDIDPIRDADLTVGEYAQRFEYGWAFEMPLCTLNNCLVLLENADEVIEGDPSLVDYARFRGLQDLPSPETTRCVVPLHMDEERLGLVCDGGVPYVRWVLSDGLNAVQLHEEGLAVEMLTCFQRVAGMSCERIFDGGFLDMRVNGERHRFDQVHLRPYGYENHSKTDPQEQPSLLMFGDRMWLNLAAPGEQVQWVVDEATMVTTAMATAQRQVYGHGWDEEARCLFFTTIDDRPNLVGVRPQGYDGFTDEEILGFLGTEWPETVQGAKPMHTEAWVAVGPEEATAYAGQEGSLHTFSARDGGCLMVGVGSTRTGARAELEAAREGQEAPRQRQGRRYAAVARRAPRLEVEGIPSPRRWPR